MRLSNGPYFKWSRIAIVKKRHVRTLCIYGRFCELEIEMFRHKKKRETVPSLSDLHQRVQFPLDLGKEDKNFWEDGHATSERDLPRNLEERKFSCRRSGLFVVDPCKAKTSSKMTTSFMKSVSWRAGSPKIWTRKRQRFTLIWKLNTIAGSPKKWTRKRRFYTTWRSTTSELHFFFFESKQRLLAWKLKKIAYVSFSGGKVLNVTINHFRAEFFLGASNAC